LKHQSLLQETHLALSPTVVLKKNMKPKAELITTMLKGTLEDKEDVPSDQDSKADQSTYSSEDMPRSEHSQRVKDTEEQTSSPAQRTTNHEGLVDQVTTPTGRTHEKVVTLPKSPVVEERTEAPDYSQAASVPTQLNREHRRREIPANPYKNPGRGGGLAIKPPGYGKVTSSARKAKDTAAATNRMAKEPGASDQPPSSPISILKSNPFQSNHSATFLDRANTEIQLKDNQKQSKLTPKPNVNG